MRLDNDIPFMVTRQVKEMAAACHALIESREMGVVFGEPGVGKTITALHIIAEWRKRGKPKALYTEVDVGASPAGVATKLLRVMADIRPANASDALRIIENLSMEQELVLILLDEAERLSRQSIEMVRAIYDRTRVPIMLIGMLDILRELRSHKKFYSRIGIAYHYEPLSHDQLAELLGRLHPQLRGIDPIEEGRLLEYIYRATRGEFRRINRLVKQAERVRKANKHPVLSLPIFEAASKLLLNVE
jgi:hypothetical protein